MTLIKLPTRPAGRSEDACSSISDAAPSSGFKTPETSTTELLSFHKTPHLQLHHLPQHNSLLVKVQPPNAPATSDGGSHNTTKEAKLSALARSPCDIVLVIDVSASMGLEAPAPDEAKETKEDYGLSILDLTKHAARTILETLDERDRLAIVAYASDARVVQPLEPMTESNKKNAVESIDELTPTSSTNLWHGITTAIDLFDEEQTQSGRVPAIMVLTDGRPNHMCPAKGYVPKLRDIKERCGGDFPAAVHTFGFGYDLRSGLLKSIAEIGSGNYAFIPDAGMIGTVFVHAVANLQATYANRANLRLTYPRDVVVAETMGDTVDKQDPVTLPGDESAMQLTIPLGSLQYGQSRDLLLRITQPENVADEAVRNPSTISVTLNYACMTGEEHGEKASISVGGPATATATVTDTGTSEAEIAYHLSRSQICAYLSSLIPSREDGEHIPLAGIDGRPREDLQTLINQVSERANAVSRSNGGKPDVANQSLVRDLAGPGTEGQISLAINNDDYWRSWGKHYLPSLLNAHTRQICNSFKDPGPLQYGADSPLFVQCRDLLDAAFDRIPPPKPSRVNRNGEVYRGKINMSRYNDSSNPCFAGSSRVTLVSGDGEQHSVPMRKLRRGMAVLTPRGPRRVVAVLVTPVNRDIMCKVRLGSGVGDGGAKEGRRGWRDSQQDGLIVTPWHPLSFGTGTGTGKTWAFPVQLAESGVRYTGCVYSVLLQPDADPAAHAMLVGAGSGGNTCWGVTLGHGIVSEGASDDVVRAHPFFGDYAAVVASLKSLGVWKNGLVLGGGTRRDGRTGMVCGFKRATVKKRELAGAFFDCKRGSGLAA